MLRGILFIRTLINRELSYYIYNLLLAQNVSKHDEPHHDHQNYEKKVRVDRVHAQVFVKATTLNFYGEKNEIQVLQDIDTR